MAGEKIMGRRGAWFSIGGMLMALLGCATTAPQRGGNFNGSPSDELPTGFLNKQLEVNGVIHRYAVYVPADYDPSLAWPLVFFLHGAGERGNDGLKQTQVGIGRAIRLYPERFPAIVVFPQCPEGKFWDAILPAMEAMLSRTQAEYHIDEQRRYLTGLSMGGYGTFLWGGSKPDTFAALMPICGGGRLEDITKHAAISAEDVFGDFDTRLKNLSATPVWIFHGSADATVPPERSREMADLLKKAGADVQYTEFEGVEHNSWDAAYDMKKATDWLLKQRK